MLCMYASVVITEYIYPLLTICYSLYWLSNCSYKLDSKGKGPQNVGVNTYDQNIHIRTHLHTHMHTHTTFSYTRIIQTLCLQTTKFWSKRCTYILYGNIFICFLLFFVFVYCAYHFSVNLCVYIATGKLFIVQLFIKCSSIIGGIKRKGNVLLHEGHVAL